MTQHLNRIEIDELPDGRGWEVCLWYAPSRPQTERIVITAAGAKREIVYFADEVECRTFSEAERGAMISFVTRLAASMGMPLPAKLIG